MPLYVGLFNWTEQGIRAVKDTVKRSESLEAAIVKAGCKLRNMVWTMGPYDALAIFEAPDDITASRLTLAMGMQGNTRSLTMRAFTREDMGKIVGGLP
jgi:uncharacterized protein with GYD domain